jgi:hypothetical protein
MRSSAWPPRLLLATAAVLAAAAAEAADYRPPLTAEGVPDLQGTWTNAWLTRTERASDFTTLSIPEAQAREYERQNAGRVKMPKDPVGQEASEWPEVGDQLARIRNTPRTSWIYDPADGKIPYRPEVREANKAQMEAWENRFDHPEQRPPRERCMGVGQAGPPLGNAADLNVLLIVQTRDHVAIVAESNQTARIIRLGGTHAPKALRQWMGDAVGRWEGPTLVVETTNFHPAQYRTPGGGETKVVERFTRTGPAEIHYAYTVENPALYTQRWRGEMVLRPSRGPLFEFACHEGNYALENILRGGRVAEAEAGAGQQVAGEAAAPATAAR